MYNIEIRTSPCILHILQLFALQLQYKRIQILLFPIVTILITTYLHLMDITYINPLMYTSTVILLKMINTFWNQQLILRRLTKAFVLAIRNSR